MRHDQGFEEEEENGKENSGCLWNVLTFFLLVATAIMVAIFILIYSNPYISLNPFPPPQVGVVVAANNSATATPHDTNTESATDTVFPLTWTPTLAQSLTFTATTLPATATVFPPTWTPTAIASTDSQSATDIPVIIATNTATPIISLTPTIRPDMPYAILGNPSAVSSTFTHPDSDCKWLGVGGQVLDMQDAPIVGTTIELSGILNGASIDLLSLSGTALQYGTAGYEFTLGSTPIASTQTLWIQLLDQAGQALSDKVYFNTYADCNRNLILITFKQVRK